VSADSARCVSLRSPRGWLPCLHRRHRCADLTWLFPVACAPATAPQSPTPMRMVRKAGGGCATLCASRERRTSTSSSATTTTWPWPASSSSRRWTQPGRPTTAGGPPTRALRYATRNPPPIEHSACSQLPASVQVTSRRTFQADPLRKPASTLISPLCLHGGSTFHLSESSVTERAFCVYSWSSYGFKCDDASTQAGSPPPPHPELRAYKASYNRPFATRAYRTVNMPFNSEYPFVRWLERNGYDVVYWSGTYAPSSCILLTQLGSRQFRQQHSSGCERLPIAVCVCVCFMRMKLYACVCSECG
jgi:hypothetical protein